MEREATNVGTLVQEFGKYLHNVHQARIEMGRIYLDIVEALGSKAAAERKLRAAYPDAKEQIGYVLNTANLDKFADTYRTFGEGGFASPDGKHVVTLEDLAPLNLNPAELQAVGNAVETGKVRVNKLLSKARRAAMSKAEENVDDVENVKAQIIDMATESDQPVTRADRIAALVSERDKKVEQIEKLQADVARLNREIAALESGEEPDTSEDEQIIIPPTSGGESIQAATA